MDSIPVGDLDAYWATAAQIAVVLALALVLELRYMARRWSPDARGRALRRFQAAYYLVGGVFTLTAINIPLGVLQRREYTSVVLTAEQWLLSLAFGFVILGPILDVSLGAYGDALSAAFDRLPWSRSSKLRRELDDLDKVLAADVKKTLETLERQKAGNEEAKRALEEMDRAIADLRAIANDPAADPDERARAKKTLRSATLMRAQAAVYAKTMRGLTKRVEKKALREMLDNWTRVEKARDGIDAAVDADAAEMVRKYLRDIRGEDDPKPDPTTP